MVSELDKTYTKDWYRSHFEYAVDYAQVAEALDWLFGPAASMGENLTVADIGCGVGMVVAGLARHGWDAIGYEPSFGARLAGQGRYADDYQPRIHYADVTVDVEVVENLADLVVCLEVAEHIDAEHAERLVRSLALTVAAGGAIVFTAAPPGQPGHQHVNCQPKSYWVKMFSDLGCSLDEHRTKVLKDALDLACPKMRWIPENVMVFTETG